MEGRDDYEDLSKIFDGMENQVVMPGVTFVCSESYLNQIGELFETKSKEIAEQKVLQGEIPKSLKMVSNSIEEPILSKQDSKK